MKKINIEQYKEDSSAKELLLLITSEAFAEKQARALLNQLGRNYSVFLLSGEMPESSEVDIYTKNLIDELSKKGVKFLTVLGIKEGANIAQALCVSASKMVRRLILLNPTSRLRPNLSSKIIDYFEGFLPLGLPLRNLSNDFDSRPFLHRIHCPTLVLTSEKTSSYLKEQSKIIAERIPNSWLKRVNSFNDENMNLSTELVDLVKSFQKVPVKRPQKNLGRAHT